MVVQVMPYKILAFGLSDVGLVRENNEDAWGAVPELGFFVLADGMGGHQAGEVASHETVNSISAIIKKNLGRRKNISYSDTVKVILRAIEEVNKIVYDHSRADPELRGMGTTLCCLQFHEQGLIFAHVGDSRIYRMRDGKLTQITTDHSLMRELIDLGQLSEGEAPEFLYKNILTKALGTEPSIDPTINACEIANNDTYMMCSDGLSDLLTLADMQRILNKKQDVEDSVRQLVLAAKERGGHDNITIVVVRLEEMFAPRKKTVPK
jgi:serine/threonine protein phosphatase PrpC